MVHILRYKIDDTVQYLLVGNEPTVKELTGIGYEYIANLGINVKGQYSSTQLKELLSSTSERTDKELELAKNRVENLEERKVKIKEILDKLE